MRLNPPRFHSVAGNLPAIIHRITERVHLPLAELRSDAPAVLGHIIDRALAKTPAERYKTGLDLAADLDGVDRGQGSRRRDHGRNGASAQRNATVGGAADGPARD